MKNLAAYVLVTVALASPAASVYDRYAPIARNITWASCSGNDTTFLCGTLDVPLDYANVNAGKAILALSKYPATSEPRLGTIFLNPGGPGNSGVDFVAQYAVNLSQIIGGQYDLVSWDPRGVGSTYPRIDCFHSTEEESEFWHGNLAYAGIEAKGNFTNANMTDPDVEAFWAQEPETDRLSAAVGQKCLRENGDNLRFVGTAAAARDLISLADAHDGAGALVNYWGFSYGSVIGSYFVNMFPDRVGRLIIDGVVDPVIWANTPIYKFHAYHLQNVETVFAGFAAACAMAGPQGCAIAENNSTQASIQGWVHDVMDASYDYLKSGGDYGSSEFRNYLLSYMYHPKDWSSVAESLKQTADLVYGRNTSSSIAEIVSLRTRGHHLRPAVGHHVKRTVDPTTFDYAVQAIICSDNVDAGNVTTVDVFNEIVYAALNVSQTFGPMFTPLGFWCHKWPARAVERYTGPWNHTLKTPILVIGIKADPATPFVSAKATADRLGENAYLVEQDEFGHTTLGEHSNCTEGIIRAYFQNGTYPTRGQFCTTNQVLFPSP